MSKHQKNFNNDNNSDYMNGYLAEMESRKEKDPDTSFTRK